MSLILIIGALIFPVDDANKVMIPDWFYCFAVLAPLFVAAIRKLSVVSRKKGQRQIAEFRAPKRKKVQEELAAQLLDEISTNVSLANKVEHISLLVEYYDEALAGFEKLSKLDKVKFKGSPQYDLFRLRDEIQWHMCDAIQRHKDRVISEIKGKYRNSREFQKRAYTRFKIEIDDQRDRFSEETGNFADKSLREIEGVLGISSAKVYISPSSRVTHAEISEVDGMDGHTFELWCAELLKKNGFDGVQVTQGSGDQGVDVLAVKDGIKYAIQCKCYSSDLGNKPIQEVNTGKTIYHCQIGVVMTNRYFTAGGKDAAEATGVLLWDRDKPEELLKHSLEVSQ